ncbi:response regulator [Erythrobacter arachoides]|uniref:Response regulator n=1 Tax=Aurantiacibacter arachoides TaxID=1850444 RepID=A0A845A8E0_9SPHN|nr:response regulator [Aurantiacibacter arachoides]MXO93809.1 response regulator [Aurantiacibacter arachoides]GGD46518.1 response regulator [Aurantiacibacter arachoides]
MASQPVTHQPRVLVVEDEFIIALDLSETVRDLGYRVEGPYANKGHAFIAIDQEMPDVAILDVMTADGEVFPLADALTEAGVPIIFHSGHITSCEIAQRYPSAQAASKPCPPDRLIAMIETACGHAH